MHDGGPRNEHLEDIVGLLAADELSVSDAQLAAAKLARSGLEGGARLDEDDGVRSHPLALDNGRDNGAGQLVELVGGQRLRLWAHLGDEA